MTDARIETEQTEDYVVVRINGRNVGAIWYGMDAYEFIDDLLFELGYRWGRDGKIFRREIA